MHGKKRFICFIIVIAIMLSYSGIVSAAAELTLWVNSYLVLPGDTEGYINLRSSLYGMSDFTDDSSVTLSIFDNDREVYSKVFDAQYIKENRHYQEVSIFEDIKLPASENCLAVMSGKINGETVSVTEPFKLVPENVPEITVTSVSTVADQSIDISWNPIEGATDYNIIFGEYSNKLYYASNGFLSYDSGSYTKAIIDPLNFAGKSDCYFYVEAFANGILVGRSGRHPFEIPDYRIDFFDLNFESAVRKAINKPDGDLWQSDVIGLKQLDASSRGITSTEGLQYLSNLESLDLSDNNLSEMSYYYNLTKLVSLNLSNNNITSLHFQYVLYDSLISLNISNNEISSFSELRGMINLKELFLSSNNTEDYSPVSGYYNNLINKDFTYEKEIIEINVANPHVYFNKENSTGHVITRCGLLAATENTLRNTSLSFSVHNPDNSIAYTELINTDSIIIHRDSNGSQRNPDYKYCMYPSASINLPYGEGYKFAVSTNTDGVEYSKTVVFDVKPVAQVPEKISFSEFRYRDDGLLNYLSWTPVEGADGYTLSLSYTGGLDPNPSSILWLDNTTNIDDLSNIYNHIPGSDIYIYITAQKDGRTIARSSEYTFKIPDSHSQFEDANFESLIRETINKPEGSIIQSDLNGITELDASNRDIKSIAGIEYMENLIILDLRYNSITDISPLTNLEGIDELYLEGNNIQDYSPTLKFYQYMKVKDFDMINSLIYGDVNGDKCVNSIDFALMRKALLGTEKFSSKSTIAADVYDDGKFNSIDFAYMRKYLLGMIDLLPVCKTY